MKHWTLRQRLKNDVLYVLVRVALAIVRPLPHRLLVLLGRAIGGLVFVLARRERALAIENLARVFPERAPSLARRCFVELGGLLGDTLALLRARERACDRLPFAPGARAVLERARASGVGVVLVTAHLGPWERLAAALVEAGFPLTTPVRTSYDPRIEAHVVSKLRRGRGVAALDRDDPGTGRALVRALRRGEVAGFLVDVDTRVASVSVPFFGATVRTPSGAARLALGTGAPVVAAFATRAGIVVEEVRPASERVRADDAAVLQLVAAMNDAIERAILREPERWIWMHDRWGTRRAVEVAADKSESPPSMTPAGST